MNVCDIYIDREEFCSFLKEFQFLKDHHHDQAVNYLCTLNLLEFLKQEKKLKLHNLEELHKPIQSL